MGRLVFAAACGTLLLSACGARTGQLPPWITDGGSVKVDAPATDTLARFDGRTPPDRNMHDACLPIPASQVQGYYKGLWKGSWTCSGRGAQSISGSLYFSLTPSGGAESFKVVGAMNGMVSGTMPFSTNITGTMGCTALSATLPYIQVGSGALMLQLTGSIKSALSVSSSGKPGFSAGGWTAKEKGPNPCTASGSWSAFQ